jgi:short-subunit dehydrogenase
MRTFDNKTVFLTGAASGIGRELAKQLAALGCHLYLVDIDEARLNEVATELAVHGKRIWTTVCDLSKPEAVHQMLAECDRRTEVVDAVINNAGVAYYGPTEAMTQQQWDWLMNINLLAPIQITNHFLPQLLQRPDAHIANMCSIAGIVAGGRFTAYHASKFGLIGFTESLRAEYGRKGIGVTAICPGPVKTNLYEDAATGRQDTQVPMPPGWLCASAERVAALTIKAIRRNKRQTVITPMAHALFQLKRFAPGLIDFANQFSRKKKKRIALLQQQEAERLANAESESTQKKAA